MSGVDTTASATSAATEDSDPSLGLADLVTVVVRSAGERTVDACRELVAQQANGLEVQVIEERPFSAAVRRGFEIGVDRGRSWTWCVDADVLVRRDALRDLVDAAEAAPSSTFCIEGRIADTLMGMYRPAGNHLYRTELLPVALDRVEITNAVIRPERHVKDQMSEIGHGLVWADLDIGLHDAEQYFADILRTALVYCDKFSREVAEYAAEYWKQSSQDDLRVAWIAHTIRPIYQREMRIDRSAFPRSIDTLLTLAGMAERAPLDPTTFDVDRVSELLDAFEPAPEWVEWQQFCQRYESGRFGPVSAMLHRHGPVGLARHLIVNAMGARS